MTQERAHRKYSPSQAERFTLCPGSTNLLKRVPARPVSPYAVEGTKAHTVLETALNAGQRNARQAHRDSVLFFEVLDDGKNEFYFAIQAALDYIYSILDEHDDAVMYVETFVDPPVSALPGSAGGYCDVAIFSQSARVLYVIDYKHGAGVTKAAKGNLQAMQYGAGFLYQDDPFVDPASVDSVVLAIVQPRAFHEDGIIREHIVTPYELYEYLEDLDRAVTASEAPDAPLRPGEVQCRFCDARTVCPAREEQALQVASASFSQIKDFTPTGLPEIAHTDLQRLARIRYHAPALRKFLDDVDAHLVELAHNGHVIPGAKLVQNMPRRRWYGDDVDTARKLAAMLGERDGHAASEEIAKLFEKYPVLHRVWNIKLVALTTAEKMVVETYKSRVGRGRKKAAAQDARKAFAYLTLKEQSPGLTLVNEDDPRPAVDRAAGAFSNLQIAPPPMIESEKT